MASDFDVPWLHLTPDEEVLWAGHRSVYLVLPPIVLGIVLLLLGAGIAGSDVFGGFSWVGILLIPVGFAIAIPPFVRWRSEWFVLTTEEVYHKRGVFAQDVTQIRLDRVRNTAFSQSLLERILDYGTVTIHTAGVTTDNLVFENVSNPQSVNGLLTEQLDRVSPRR
ncbi:membrane-flanked domain protein [Haladaptatus paucihalophilus DX253]|uniref:Membrane-flanked domain protein n=1 Tax=Haladaptatus paucihalophilus DX253 TaxID=797209 RepID=E7QW96_HALPU|nr:PH domain-containing protein [Haladaptatus paucihalophilus]EFW91230.1 membrane-flanked domain protein [Haladaptatus paucihalophilus DX253]SHL66195.1 PH domain-containing protein [Haladaptatus paucihalophilus DX253]